jgi:Chitobiase/beta-hexosaminidase C-terminal domain
MRSDGVLSNLTLTFTLTLSLAASSALAQDPGMQAAQQATQIAIQATQQANDQMMQASQQANQAAMNASMQASQNAGCNPCGAASPKFSVKAGKSAVPVTIKLRDSTRGAVIYYTTNGWTPTASSSRYVGPITIDSTTTLQAIAIPPYGGRSRVVTAIYTISGSPSAPIQAPSITSVQSSVAASPDPTKLLLARGTVVPLVFAGDVSSKTADVGDKVALALADDIKSGDVIVVKKGTPSIATITGVDHTGMAGTPGEIFFQVDSLQAGGASIKLRGGEAKEGQDKVNKAFGLMLIPGAPVGIFVHGKDAEIKQGASFNAVVDADTFMPPAN